MQEILIQTDLYRRVCRITNFLFFKKKVFCMNEIQKWPRPLV